MAVHSLEDNPFTTWEQALLHNPDGGAIFQLPELAETKRSTGWRPRYETIDHVAVTILEKNVPLLGRYWYIPKGPGVTQPSQLIALLPALSTYAHKHGVFAVKIEPEILASDDARQQLLRSGLIQTPPIQPNSSTVLIDLSPPLDTVLATLNQKGRHAIKRAERDGVTVKAVELTDETMQTMYQLLAATASGRFETSLRDFEYYKTFWRQFSDHGHGQLFFAYFEGQVVAAAFCLYFQSKGMYKDGASLREKVTYGASHLLQWEIMKWMKARGVTVYDLCGAPPSNAINDTTHKLYGVGRFKTSFNKHVTDYIGCYDLPVRPLAYRVWNLIGLRLVVSLTWRLKHQQWF